MFNKHDDTVIKMIINPEHRHRFMNKGSVLLSTLTGDLFNHKIYRMFMFSIPMVPPIFKNGWGWFKIIFTYILSF